MFIIPSPFILAKRISHRSKKIKKELHLSNDISSKIYTYPTKIRKKIAFIRSKYR